MKISDPNHQEILKQVGLLYLGYFDSEKFIGYISHAYQNSETEAMDEIYRMYEHVLLHKDSGLRVSYLTTESYFGDTVEYIVIDCFVFTKQNQKLGVTAIDLEKQTFETTAGTLSFKDVRNSVAEGD